LTKAAHQFSVFRELLDEDPAGALEGRRDVGDAFPDVNIRLRRNVG